MKKYGVAIFAGSDDLAAKLAELVNKSEDLEVCAQTADGNLAVELVKSTPVDVAVVDLVLTGIDGFGVLDAIKSAKPDCKSIVIGGFVDDKIVDRAIEHGAYYYLAKPVKVETLLDRIGELISENASVHKKIVEGQQKRKNNSLNERISNIFITIGIPPHIKGFSYLREGIKMAVENPAIINRVTKELYPKIGEKFSTTASKVERAIRHAIEVAWNRGRTDAISSIFGARVYIGNERPTNSEFIALVADKLILESLD